MMKYTIYYKAPLDYMTYEMYADNEDQLIHILQMLKDEHCYKIEVEVNRHV